MTRRQFRLLCSVPLVAATAATASFASTASFTSANDCVAGSGATITHGFGAFNFQSTAQVTVCPVHWVGSAASLDSSTTFVYYGDHSTTDGLACFATTMSDTATLYSGATKYSCATAGGCTSPSVSFSGNGYIQTGALPSGTKVASSIHCSLPAFVSTQSGIVALVTTEI